MKGKKKPKKKPLFVIQICVLSTTPCHHDRYIHHACEPKIFFVFEPPVHPAHLSPNALENGAMPLCHVILGALAALRNLPIDVLIRGLDVASLAMYAAVMIVSIA